MMCKTPGCLRPKHELPTGDGYYDYCSTTCRDEHQGKQTAAEPSVLTSGMFRGNMVPCTMRSGR